MDNYYTSPELHVFTAVELNETYACGTVRVYRKLVPKAFKQVRLKKGEAIFRRNGILLALKFKDKRDVHMISTFHGAKLGLTNKVDRTGELIWKHMMNTDCFEMMGGVYLNDKICQYYDILRKSVKLWKTLFFHLLNMVIVNAFILFRKYGDPAKRRTHQNFRTNPY
ncbi:hypothetical protein FSP39_024090 [Pinctada imbricata]|uniref:PiggyBac transposable element-derived protein domain-containing protein n=1 Tax=Pinctada imbricata TaxID=66713 RepID=A0AA88XU70_PINIB|nr:hypothetical protein FSP39_024090 [Pinctada imbricata]